MGPTDNTSPLSFEELKRVSRRAVVDIDYEALSGCSARLEALETIAAKAEHDLVQGHAMRHRGHHEKSLEYLERAADFYDLNEDEAGLALALWGKGAALANTTRYNEALEVL